MHILPAARERYSYPPGLLQRVRSHSAISVPAYDLQLDPHIPLKDNTGRWLNCSSRNLDAFHSQLLNSDYDADIIHGVLSATFWGYLSGTDARLNKERALTRCRWVLDGNRRATPGNCPKALCNIVREARKKIQANQLDCAIAQIMQARFFGLAFASKIVAFIDSRKAAIYDRIIARRLLQSSDRELRRVVVAMEASQRFERWCTWCQRRAAELNSSNVRWRDWDGKELEWRAIDVERAIYAGEAG